MKKQTYKRTGNCGLFDWEENTAKLCSLGNPLEKLLKVIDFEMFRETLEAGLYKEKLSNVGAKPYDYVLTFKILGLGLNTCLAIANKVCTGCSAAPWVLFRSQYANCARHAFLLQRLLLELHGDR